MAEKAVCLYPPAFSGKVNFYRAGLLICTFLISFSMLACSGSPRTQTNHSVACNQPLYHYIQSVQGTDSYWNRDWIGNASTFLDRLTGLVSDYVKSMEYTANTIDCNDMAVSLWRFLRDNGIYSLLAAGNLEKTNETFVDCNHAWLIVYNAEGAAAAIETTTGCIILWEQVATRPQLKQYWEAFLYPGPEEMMADFIERW